MDTNLRPRKESEYNPKTKPPTINELLATKEEKCPHCDAMNYHADIAEGTQAIYQRLYFFCLICGFRKFPFPGIDTKGKSEPNRRND